MKIKAVRGFKDILAGETGLWQRAEAAAASVLRNFGYKEIRIPVVERTELFARSIGSDTDIVEKEMYSFPDRHDKSLTLRPEATAGVVRAVIEHSLAGDGRPLKLYSIGPMFRYERPQKGRQRQFHQINAEVFNVNSPHIDAEMIAMLGHILAELELNDVVMNINSLGCPVCGPDFKQKLQDFLQEKRGELCPDCQRRMDTNPLRVLDCKVPGCAELVQDAPRISDSLCPPCRDHFDAVKKDLYRTNVAFTVNPRLVRGLDYYTRTTFEAQTGELGSQNAVAGGGRYDGLVKALGGPDVPAIGFAVGLERLIMLLGSRKRQELAGPDLFVAALDEPSVEAVFSSVQELRRMGYRVETDYTPGSLKSRMKRAGKLDSARVLILGPEELDQDQGILRNMKTKEQETVPLGNDLALRLAEILSKGETT